MWTGAPNGQIQKQRLLGRMTESKAEAKGGVLFDKNIINRRAADEVIGNGEPIGLSACLSVSSGGSATLIGELDIWLLNLYIHAHNQVGEIEEEETGDT